MKILRRLSIIIITLLLVLQSCIKPDTYKWSFLGLENKNVVQLVLEKPYLYACVGSYGLWRKNIQNNSDWEYLGLADTSYPGVQDVFVDPQNSDRMLVAYNTTPDSSGHPVYRTLDRGENWTPADSGLEYYSGGQKYFNRIDRLIKVPNGAICAGQGIYSTSNFGEIWDKRWRSGSTGLSRIYSLVNNPINNEFWVGGADSISFEFLAKSTDEGLTWDEIDLSKVISHDYPKAIITDIDFDPVDGNYVYFIISFGRCGGLCKTIDGGKAWIGPLIEGTLDELVSDPSNTGHLWGYMAIFNSFIETSDGGETWKTIENQVPPDISCVYHMIYDEEKEVIYLGTNGGVYVFEPRLFYW